MEKDYSDRLNRLIDILKEPMKEPGVTLHYDPINRKIILVQMPCHDSVTEAASEDERKKKIDNHLEMLNVIIDAVLDGKAVSNGVWSAFADTLMRIRNLNSTEFSSYELDNNHKQQT